MELGLVLERELTTLRPMNGTLTDVHICQRDDGCWHINVRLSWRGATLFHVGLYDKKKVRVYKRLRSAVRHVITAYGYDAMIAVHPYKGIVSTDHF